MVLVPLRNFCKTSMEQVLQSFRETQLRVPVATDGDTNKASSNQVEASESHLDSGQVRRSLSQNMAKQILSQTIELVLKEFLSQLASRTNDLLLIWQ